MFGKSLETRNKEGWKKTWPVNINCVYRHRVRTSSPKI